MKPGVPTTEHWRVGREHVVIGAGGKRGVCVSVTPWGSNQVRWVRLWFGDGTEKSYAPSHLSLR